MRLFFFCVVRATKKCYREHIQYAGQLNERHNSAEIATRKGKGKRKSILFTTQFDS